MTQNSSNQTSADYNQENPDDAETFALTVPDSLAGSRLDAALAQMLPEYSRSRISAWIKDGRVLLGGSTAAGKLRLIGGEKLCITPDTAPEENAYLPENIVLDIVHEDEDILVLNKSAGLVVHPAAGNWQGTLLNGLLYHFPELAAVPRAGIVHRLDKDTSGLMVVAKNIPAQTALVRQLQARTVKRRYRAVADGIVPYSGTIDAPIGRNPHNRLKMAVVRFGGKEAVTHVEILEHFAAHTYIECSLETGRTHQIRVHMRESGHPLAGDPLYGNPRHTAPAAVKAAVQQFGRQALHAWCLSFLHPRDGSAQNFQAALPADMQQLLEVLRADKLGGEALPAGGFSVKDDDWDDEDDDGVSVIYVRE